MLLITLLKQMVNPISIRDKKKLYQNEFIKFEYGFLVPVKFNFNASFISIYIKILYYNA